MVTERSIGHDDIFPLYNTTSHRHAGSLAITGNVRRMRDR